MFYNIGMERQTNYIISNVETTKKIERKLFEGVEHLIVPVIGAKEMVMNGYFYPANEFKDWIETWEGVPVPINHPKQNNVAISARSPRIQELTSVGHFFDVEFTQNNELKGNLYINIEKVKKLNADYIIEKFENGEIMEVSTGLYSNIENVSGEYNGQKYQGIVRHIRPDHLALLPNEIGACSVVDGCGAGIKNDCQCNDSLSSCGCENEKKNNLVEKVKEALSVINLKKYLDNYSHKEIKKNIHDELSKMYQEHIYIIDMYDDTVIFEKNNDRKIYKQSYKYDTEKDQYVLGDDAVEVVQKTNYVEKNKGGIYMDNSTEIKTNEVVEEVVEEVKAEETEVKEEEVTETQTEPEPEAEAEKKETEEEKEKTELVENSLIDNEKKEFIENQLKEFDAKKEALKKSLIENSTLTEEEVNTFSFNVLQKLNDVVKPKNYSGNGVSINKVEEKYEPKGLIGSLQEDK